MKRTTFIKNLVIGQITKVWFVAIVFVLTTSCSERAQTEKMLGHFLERHAERIKPLKKHLNETFWATYTGNLSFKELLKESNRTDSLLTLENQTPEFYQNILNSVYNNPNEYEIFKKIDQSGLITDKYLKRQFDKVFNNYLTMKNNWDDAEKKNSELLDGYFDLKRRENSFFDSLSGETASTRNAKWITEFSSLTEAFRGMIKAMNSDVQKLGHKNYFDYLLFNQEIDSNQLEEILEKTDSITRPDYQLLLSTISTAENKTTITPTQLREIQSTAISPGEWKKVSFSKEGFIGKVDSFYLQGQFNIGSIYSNSDIWYKKEKINNSFFYCVDFDDSDFRIYSNIEPIAYSLYPILHEFAHALHYQSVDKGVSYFLKEPHAIIAEGVAIYFDSKIYTSGKVQQQLGLPTISNNPLFKTFSNPMKLIFLRKMIRTIKFEQAIYANPDQDFNELWWKLNKEYLNLEPSPNERLPEWATSLHIIGSGGINVDYLFALAYAAQLEHYYPNDKFVPIKEKVMRYGDSLPWYELIETSTNEALNLDYLRESYLKN